MSPRGSNLIRGRSPKVTLLPTGEIRCVAGHARSPFIISHRKSLMGNHIKDLKRNHFKIYKFFFSSIYNCVKQIEFISNCINCGENVWNHMQIVHFCQHA